LVVVTMAKRGRPNKHAAEKAELLLKFNAYIAREKIPIVAEFCAQNGLYKQWLYDQPDFSDLIKRCTTKKESALERQALKGDANCSMAIFSLKQMGWSDRQEHAGQLEIVVKLPDTLSK
jgi:hypothetical protein